MVKTKRKPVPYEENHKEINGVIHKLCSDCNEWIPMEESFYKNKSAPDGHNPYCKDCTKKRSRGWAVDNLQQNKETKAMWYQENQEKLLKKQKYLDGKNKEHREVYGQEYRKSEQGKEKYREYNYKRRVKNHKISDEEWDNCKNYFNYRCAYCDIKIEDHYIKFKGEIRLGDFHREHVDDSGANDLSNCIPACKSCNTSKHTSSLKDWFNESNDDFTIDKLNKIIKWLKIDYKLYID